MSIQDPVVAILGLLNASTPITTLVGTRIFGVELPQAEADNMPRKAIVIQPSGGGFGAGVGVADFIEHSTQGFDVFCYGETLFEAESVRSEVYDVLKQIRRQVISGTLVHWINPSSGAISLRDSETAWPAKFQSFTLFFAEKNAT